MPAIDLARLKIQVNGLIKNFSNHKVFIRELHEVLNLYTNRTMRASQSTKHLSLTSFHTPFPVLRLILYEIAPLANQLPIKGTILANELWKDGAFESRLLAAHLIGMIPPTDAISLLTQLPNWLAQTTDKAIHNALLTNSFARVRIENPDAFFTLLEEWLKSKRPSLQTWGIRALIPLLNDKTFEDIPSVFRILRPTLLAASPSTQIEIKECMLALERISPTETINYIRDLVISNPTPLFLRTLRRVLPALSTRLRESLRDFVR